MNDEFKCLRMPLALSAAGFMIIELFWPYRVPCAVGFGCLLSAVIIAGKRSPLVSLPLAAAAVAWSYFMPGAALGSLLNGMPLVLGWLLGCALYVGGRRRQGAKVNNRAQDMETDAHDL